MHESVKERTHVQCLVENDHIEEGERFHMRNLGQVYDAELVGAFIKRWRGQPDACKFDGADLLQQVIGEVGTKTSPVASAESAVEKRRRGSAHLARHCQSGGHEYARGLPLVQRSERDTARAGAPGTA